MSACPNRNYCDPTQNNCGTQNRGSTWFYTDQSQSCDCVDSCFGLSSATAQDYCNNNVGSYGGGTFDQYCLQGPSHGFCCESNFICYRTGWDPNNKLGCCLGNFNDATHCESTWCPGNLGVCSDVLTTYCAQEQHVATDPTCVQFCSLPENKVYCDPEMRKYCVASPQNPLCTCINASSIPRPSCFDVQCTETGYQTQEMVMDATNCGAFCGQFIICVNAGQCNINDPAFVQQCGNVNPPSPTPSNGNIFERLPIWVWLVIGVVLLTLVFIIGAYLLHRKGKT